MNYLYIGKIVNTHGIKGEVKLLSNFERKDLIFKKNFKIYIGKNHEQLIINSYRVHKNFDMLTFLNINDINDVLQYKGENAYIVRDELEENLHLKDDLIGYSVIYNEKNIGKVSYFFSNSIYDIMAINSEKKEYLVPYLDKFILNIDYTNKTMYLNTMKGLIDEN